MIVELQALDNAEPVSQRRRQQTSTCGCPHQRKRRQIQLDRPCSWPFTNHDIQLIVFHGRIEHFLHRRTQAMDLVDKQDVTFLEVGEHGSQVSGLFQYRAGRRLDRDTHLIGNDVGQSGFTKPGRAENQHMIQRFLAAPGSGDKNLHLFAYRRLAHILGKQRRTDGPIMHFLIFSGLGRYQSVRFNHGIIRLLGINNMPAGSPCKSGCTNCTKGRL